MREEAMEHKPCYGKMMPDLASTASSERYEGKAFGGERKTIGLSVGKVVVSVNGDEWDDCLSCMEFDSCWKLSMSKQILQLSLKSN